MSRQHKNMLKYTPLWTCILLFFILLLPAVCIGFFQSHNPPSAPGIYNGQLPDTVQVYRTKADKTETIPFEDYIAGVVASEMPESFQPEALKAQAIASRTYALGRIQCGAKLCDTVHCQVYRSDNISQKVRRAVMATAGQVLTYENALATQALYFSSSAGPTEYAEDVFSNPYPYLVSVPSDNEPGATHKKESLAMSIKTFTQKLKKAFPKLSFGTIDGDSIAILSHTAGGRVDKIKIGNETLSGADIRSALSLYSTRFAISCKDDTIIITSSGSGHGVGMSQYGANGLALDGKSCAEILAHYYPGTEISQ